MAYRLTCGSSLPALLRLMSRSTDGLYVIRRRSDADMRGACACCFRRVEVEVEGRGLEGDRRSSRPAAARSVLFCLKPRAGSSRVGARSCLWLQRGGSLESTCLPPQHRGRRQALECAASSPSPSPPSRALTTTERHWQRDVLAGALHIASSLRRPPDSQGRRIVPTPT